MAEIPVERKTGGAGLPWWLIPLLLLALLIPLLLFLTGQCGDRAAVVDNTNGNANGNRAVTTTTTTNTTTTAANNAGNAGVVRNANGTFGGNAGGEGNSRITTEGAGTATGARVTDVNIFGSTADKASLAGREVALQNVKVNRVLSDRVFTVTSGSGEMFVLLDENLDTGGGKEQQIKMKPGQTVNINGDFERVPSADTNEERGKNLNAREFAQMRNQQIYLKAESVSDVR